MIEDSINKINNLNKLSQKLSVITTPLLNNLSKNKEITFDDIENLLKTQITKENGFSEQILNYVQVNLSKNKTKFFKDKIASEYKEVNII